VRSVPAALYKALGGFATNAINMTKLESYLFGNFSAARFYLDIEAHPAETRFKHALDELAFFADTIKILGTYPAHAFRRA
jgi:prephenate dehydratase